MQDSNNSVKLAEREKRRQEVLAKIQSIPGLMDEVEEALRYFDSGGKGVSWEEMRNRAKKR